MAFNPSSIVKNLISEIEYAYSGMRLKQILVDGFSTNGLQRTGTDGTGVFKAKFLGGHPISDFVTVKNINSIFKNGEKFDVYPTKDSNKAVQCGTLYDMIGDMSKIYEKADIKIKPRGE